MLMNESFYRCPECDHPYFEESRMVLLNKDMLDGNVAFVEKEIVQYNCKKCNFLANKATRTFDPTI